MAGPAGASLLNSESLSVDRSRMPDVRQAAALLIAVIAASGCIGPSDEDQALDAAVERIQAIGAPDGYRQASIETREIDTGAFTRQPGTVVVELAPIEEGTLSVRAIDEFLVGQGYRRYSNRVCLDVGLYSLDYVRPDMRHGVDHAYLHLVVASTRAIVRSRRRGR